MLRLPKHLAYVILFAALWLPSDGRAAMNDSLITINHLLKYVEESKCVFIRNNKEYDAHEAAQHIKSKNESILADIKTPEDFIEQAASKSMLSGQPYWVRCADHAPTLSAEWLIKELANYRKTLRKVSAAK